MCDFISVKRKPRPKILPHPPDASGLGEGEFSAEDLLRRAMTVFHGRNACERIGRKLSMNRIRSAPKHSGVLRLVPLHPAHSRAPFGNRFMAPMQVHFWRSKLSRNWRRGRRQNPQAWTPALRAAASEFWGFNATPLALIICGFADYILNFTAPSAAPSL